ncbi:MAG TPA: SHOCT domain-containing protein [Solirubrobacterales bacterium]|nr:SHOCT domain-containing protein [Solirubrobacterales bacterium]
MSRGRRRLVRVLIVLGSLLAFLSVFAIWTERQALDTGEWVNTSGRLIQNSKVREAVSNYLVDQLYENVDVEAELKSILPGDTKELAGPAAGGLRQVAGDGAEKVLETSTAQSLWEDANRSAHEQLISVLEDKGDAVSTSEGNVSLNLGSLLTNLASQVGIGQQLAEKLPPDAGQIEILRSDQLKTAQNIAIAIKGLALVLSILTFAAFAAAIYLSRDSRWVTVLFSGLGLIAAGFAVIVFRHIAGGIVVDQLVVTESAKPAGEATWSIATSLMTSIATTVIVVGVLFSIAGWLGSPTGSARTSRRAIAPVLRDYITYVYTCLALVVCFYFLSGPTQGLRTFLTTLVVAAMAAFGIHELRKQTVEEYPDASYGDSFSRTKDRVTSAVKGANLGERASKLRLPEMKRPSAEGSAAGDAPATAEASTAVLPSDEDARLQRLERLASLREKGILTDEEFAAEKTRLLSDGGPDR